MPKRAIATFAGATWGLGALGGLAILGLGTFIWEGGETDLRVRATEQRETIPALLHDVEPSDRRIFVDVTEGAGIDFLHVNIKTDAMALGAAGAVVFDFGCAADYDKDGDPDMFASYFGPSRLYRKNGDGTFSDVTTHSLGEVSSQDRTMGCAWGDYDRDGHLDLVVVNHLKFSVGMNILDRQLEDIRQDTAFLQLHDSVVLYHSNGDGTFNDVSRLLGDPSGPSVMAPLGNLWGAGFQPGWVDYDNDGDLDLYVVNDFGEQLQPIVLWRNDGPEADSG